MENNIKQNQAPKNHKQHIVIVGGGFGGLEAAKRLRNSKVQVTLVDRRNFHLFQPLLYQVATGALSSANIATPLRYILRRQKNCNVVMADVVGFDVENQKLLLKDGELQYDKLILAAGASHSYFGRDDWAQLAPGLKTVEDAAEIRRRIFTAFEAAERESDASKRAALMTFVIVGGGATGIELGGALAEIAHHTLKYDFRAINPSDARILLIEAAPHILAHYPEELSKRAADRLQKMGIEIRTLTKVTDIQTDHVKLQSDARAEEILTQTVLWGAGVQANPLGKKLAEATGLQCDRAGRVPVQSELTIAGHPEIYVVGDMASCPNVDGKPLPGLAPVAIQQGQYVAEQIDGSIDGQNRPSKPFRYRDRGTMATLGRSVAVAQIGKKQFCGFFAWLMWIFIHLLQIAQFENRIIVLWQWMWTYLTYNRSARLITSGSDKAESIPMKPQQAPPEKSKEIGSETKNVQ